MFLALVARELWYIHIYYISSVNTVGDSNLFLIVLIELPLLFFSCFMVALILTRIIISIISEQSIKDNLLFLIPQQISCGLFIYKAFINNNIKSI